MNIFHLVYDLMRGGTEGQCARVAMGLNKRGNDRHQVGVFHRQGYFLNAVEETCGPVYEMKIRKFVALHTLQEIHRLARFLKMEKIDLLHTWDADAAIFGQFAAKWAGIPLVTSRRDMGEIYPIYKDVFLKRADRAAVRVVVNARSIQDRLGSAGLPAEKMALLPNLLNVREFDDLRQKPFSKINQLPSGRRLVVVNRLDPEKNVGLLIEALPMVKQTVPDATLVVAGSGREAMHLQEKARQAGVESSVSFLGEIQDVPALLSQCEIGALVSSRNEGLSNTILEYMAAGLPVLATDCGGNAELVHNGRTGVLISCKAKPEDVSTAWISLLANREHSSQLGQFGRNMVVSRFDEPVALNAFSRFYSSIQIAAATPRYPPVSVTEDKSGY